MNDLVYRYRKVDEDFFEELEEILIGADVGVATVMELIDQLKKKYNVVTFKIQKVQAVISEKLVGIYKGDSDFSNEINMQEGPINGCFIC
ncbi:signal recognition particle receptor subunit alpha [Bacillus cereus]